MAAKIFDITSQLKRDEGEIRDASGLHVAYLCSSRVWTIGWGHNLEANPVPGIGRLPSKGKPWNRQDPSLPRLTDDQAERLLAADIAAVTKEIAAALPWASSLDDARFGVLVNMGFNMGVPALLRFEQALEALSRGSYGEAGLRMSESRWAVRQAPARAERLATQMKTGVWQ